MGTITQTFKPESAGYRNVKVPELERFVGSDFNVFYGMMFDPGDVEECLWSTIAVKYGSGDLTFDIYWFADTATSGDVKWEIEVGEIEANVDTTAVDAVTLAAAQTVVDSHLGTIGRRLHKATIAYTAPSGMAVDASMYVRFRRLGTDPSDTMSGNAGLAVLVLNYSDT